MSTEMHIANKLDDLDRWTSEVVIGPLLQTISRVGEPSQVAAVSGRSIPASAVVADVKTAIRQKCLAYMNRGIALECRPPQFDDTVDHFELLHLFLRFYTGSSVRDLSAHTGISGEQIENRIRAATRVLFNCGPGNLNYTRRDC
jgi:hypothetical protein